MAAWVAALLLVAVLLVLLSRRCRGRCPAGAREPPVAPGGLPLLGNALQLARHGATFVRQQRQALGDVFTLRLPGAAMTFVFAPPALLFYFTAPDTELAFTPAVEQFTRRIFGLPPHHFLGKHLTMLRALRHLLAPGALPPLGEALLGSMAQELSRLPVTGQVELYGLVQRLVFRASVSLLFGPTFLKRGGRDRLHALFCDFDGGFEMAASPVPHVLQPRFAAARRRLLAALRESQLHGDFAGTVAGSLVEACQLPERYVPNMLLALLWASQANTAPVAFWAAAFLLLPRHRRHREALLSGLLSDPACSPADSTAAGGGGGGGAAGWKRRLLAQAADRRSLLARCSSEALRLRSVVMDVRVAAADVSLPAEEGQPPAWVRKGSVVAICPYESHLDSRLYRGASPPEAFDPDRQGLSLGGSHAQHGAVVGVGGVAGLSFGGGKYRCPGRYFAEMEIPLLVGLLLLTLDRAEIVPTSDVASGTGAAFPGDPDGLLPPPDMRRMVGVKIPSGLCVVQYAKRPGAAASCVHAVDRRD